MPKGIYKHKPISEEQKKKQSEAMKKKTIFNFKKGHLPWNKNTKGLTKANSGSFGNKIMKGSSHWHWKGGMPKCKCGKELSTRETKICRKCFESNQISSLNERQRRIKEYKLWRKACMERDNFFCQKYKVQGGYLVVHHINNFSEFPELRFAIDNGITLSEKAHKEFHKKYGTKNNTKEQLQEFLK